jgi:hypothetical protein
MLWRLSLGTLRVRRFPEVGNKQAGRGELIIIRKRIIIRAEEEIPRIPQVLGPAAQHQIIIIQGIQQVRDAGPRGQEGRRHGPIIGGGKGSSKGTGRPGWRVMGRWTRPGTGGDQL